MAIEGYVLKLAYFNRAAPGANEDIIASGQTNLVTGATTMTSFQPSVDGYMAISIALATASVVNLTETYSGTTNTYGLERSATIAVLDLYGWSLIPVSVACTYNIRVETDSVISRLFIAELQNGVCS